MQGKELIRSVYQGTNSKPGFWLGNPTVNAKKNYCDYFGIQNDDAYKVADTSSILLTSDDIGPTDIEVARRFGSDILFVPSEPGAWKHPEGKPMWDVAPRGEKHSMAEEGVFANVEDPREIEDFNWPDPGYLDFTDVIQTIDEAEKQGLAIYGGMWCTFYHVAADFFGMENYFVKMYTDPEVVLAVTERIVDFYLEANKRCFDLMGSKLTSAFFGNDFGSQLSCMISIPFFEKFVKPFMKKLVDQMKSYNLKTTMHSCGAVYDLIPIFIELGIDALHPLQAKAAGMEPRRLKDSFGEDIIFVGGVDTQELLPFGTPAEIRDEVRRLKDIFKNNYIVSPSHEALLENVSVENVLAMCEAAKE